jgi:malonyl-CoA decarboxylase
MPGEPLVFVEIALVGEMADRIAPLLDAKAPRGDPRDATTAVFYSISNCQRGLAGISLGNALIKRVVDALSADFPRLRQFATLSPVPGFRAWLSAQPQDGEGLSPALSEPLAKRTWYRDAAVATPLRRPLTRLCSRYLLDEKASDGGPRDPVERFHLGNGARLERLNWLADTSVKGMRESAGMMVNYLYRAEEIDANREAYASQGKIAASKAVRDLRTAR